MSFLTKLKEWNKEAIALNAPRIEVQWYNFFRILDQLCKKRLKEESGATFINVDLSIYASPLVQKDMFTEQGRERLSLFLGELPFTITGNILHITWGEL